MNEQDIQKLRAAGYSDDDIRDYMVNQPQVSDAPTQTQVETLPEIDVTKPSDTLKQAEAAGIPTGARESSLASDIAIAAPAVLAEHGGKIALGAGGLGAAYTANQIRKGMQAQAAARQAQAAAQMAQAQATMAQTQAMRPVTPSAPTTSPILDAQGRPMSARPVAPAGQMAQAAEQAATRAPSLLDKTTSMVRQLAASKVFDTLAKGSTALQLATYSPELGPPVPRTGRMRGMEINPMTGRPWTREQLQAYESNPAQFDTALAAAQMPR